MRSPTTLELRRVLRGALLAATPVAVIACGSGQGPRTPPPHNAADAGTTTTPPPVATCHHTPVDITGCGGGEVKFPDGIAACHLPEPTGNVDPPLSDAVCKEMCAGFETRACRMSERDGAPEIYCEAAHPCMGRLASDGTMVRAAYTDGVVEHLAFARRMEAHSVAAFAELAADLERWDAPADLVEACRRAARDEARHADAMGRLLGARGVDLEALPATATAGFSSLMALARHNEREGVAGETWGALVAAHQVAHARDADLAAELAQISDEETDHAAISFAIASWVRTRLDAADVRALDDERRDAFRRLRDTRGAQGAPQGPAREHLGWPSPVASAAMLDALAPMFA